MAPHLNRLIETVQMRGHNICFDAELTKITPNYHQILLIYSSESIKCDYNTYWKIFYNAYFCEVVIKSNCQVPNLQNFVVIVLTANNIVVIVSTVNNIVPVVIVSTANNIDKLLIAPHIFLLNFYIGSASVKK